MAEASAGALAVVECDFWLYRIYSATGQCLYIGVTSNGLYRLDAHGRSKAWWPEVSRVAVTHYETRHALLAAERGAIRAECPLYNGTHARGGQLSLDLPLEDAA
jgi:predicted GIY-YIG superfamily endonuclease